LEELPTDLRSTQLLEPLSPRPAPP
jgi:hypothetical protein